MQIVESTSALLIKIAEPQELFEDKGCLSFVELCIQLQERDGIIDDVSLLCVIKQLGYAGLVEEKLGATMREYYLKKNVNEYERTRQALIAAYETKPFSLVDGAVKGVLAAEEKAILEDGIENGNGLIANDSEEFRGRKKSKLNKKGEIS